MSAKTLPLLRTTVLGSLVLVLSAACQRDDRSDTMQSAEPTPEPSAIAPDEPPPMLPPPSMSPPGVLAPTAPLPANPYASREIEQEQEEEVIEIDEPRRGEDLQPVTGTDSEEPDMAGAGGKHSGHAGAGGSSHGSHDGHGKAGTGGRPSH